MTTFELVNPRVGVKAARIALRTDAAALLVVDLAEEPGTGQRMLVSMEVENGFKGLNGAKISYSKKYQRTGKGYEKPRWAPCGEGKDSPPPAPSPSKGEGKEKGRGRR